MDGLEQAIANMRSLSSWAVPMASVQAVNRVAVRAVSRSVKRVSGETQLRQKLIRQRVRLRRANIDQSVPGHGCWLTGVIYRQ